MPRLPESRAPLELGRLVDSTPYVQRGFGQGIVTVNGTPLVEEQEIRVIQADRGFAGIASYPFSRAQRVEFTGGCDGSAASRTSPIRLFDINSGQQLSEDRQTLSTFPTLNLGLASTALVSDTSIFGATSPIRGSRYRLQFDETTGTCTTAPRSPTTGRT